MKKVYDVTKDTHEWECRVEIDETFIIPAMSKPGEPYTTKDAIKAMVEFWSGHEQRLFLNDGDYIKTFLQQLARECYYIAIQNNYNTLGVVGEFENREGWWPMDGSAGIEITFTDDIEIDHEEFEVEEVAA